MIPASRFEPEIVARCTRDDVDRASNSHPGARCAPPFSRCLGNVEASNRRFPDGGTEQGPGIAHQDLIPGGLPAHRGFCPKPTHRGSKNKNTLDPERAPDPGKGLGSGAPKPTPDPDPDPPRTIAGSGALSGSGVGSWSLQARHQGFNRLRRSTKIPLYEICMRPAPPWKAHADMFVQPCWRWWRNGCQPAQRPP